ncbi:MAG TPA: MauE/DoxX family redox-associated membrane protein [Candidatus Angelobacter sp.]|jgi:hypothetical protein|nr:MauE/DoxX family redox-associated membrane protein [Candidatus Angelobacter sp.]
MSAAAALASAAGAMAGTLLLVAGAAKLVDRAGIAPLLRGLGAPASLLQGAQVAVPGVEAACGAWLLTSLAPLPASAVAALLSAAFVATLLLAAARGVAEPCRCFGALDRAGSRRVAVARAALLVAVSLVALGASLSLSLRGAGAGATAGAPAWWLGVLLALGAVLAFALIGEVAAFRTGVRRRLAADAHIDHKGQAR